MQLRPATLADIPFICNQESRQDYRGYIGSYSPQEHRRNLEDPDLRYLVGEDPSGSVQGYAILRGLRGAARSVELDRVAVADPGLGQGRQLISAVMDLSFTRLRAHRLWLDVTLENRRAYRLYQELGFVQEGILREAVLLDGQYRSLVVFAMLAEEYARLSGKALPLG